jgi:uncharacterized protein (TIGR03435 family)
VDWLFANQHPASLTIHATGAQGIVALHAAVLDERISRVEVDNALTSYRSIVDVPLHRNVSEVVIPGVLRKYDVPDLVRAIAPRAVVVTNPVDGAGAAFAQAPAARPKFDEFEVASIKKADLDARGRFIQMQTAHQFLAHNHALKTLVAAAYNVSPQAISGGPAWVESEHYEILAKAPNDIRPNLNEQMTMLRALLAERFKLTFHREQKEMSVYALIVAKGGSKLKVSTVSPDSTPEGPPALAFTVMPGTLHLPARYASMDEFASLLQRSALERPVVDRTGLTGRYDFDLEFAIDETLFGGLLGKGPEDSTKPGFFAAIQEQLGLKLEAVAVRSGFVAFGGFPRINRRRGLRVSSLVGRIAQLLRFLQHLPAFLGLACLDQNLTQQIVSLVIGRIHFDGAPEHAFGRPEVLLLEVGLTEQNIGSAVIRIQPDGTLQRRDRGVPIFTARIGIAEFIVGHREVRIDRYLLQHFRDTLVELVAKNGHDPKQVVSLRNLRVEFHGARQFLLRELFEFLPNHELRGEQMRRGRFNRYAEHSGESSSRFYRLPLLNVAVAQHIEDLVDADPVIDSLLKPGSSFRHTRRQIITLA